MKNLVKILFVCFLIILLLAPVRTAKATWLNLLYENFGGEWLNWPWRICGHNWTVIPTIGYTWGIVHEIYHGYLNDQSIWCCGLYNYNITNLTPFIDTYVANMNAKAIWGPFSLEDAVDAECNFWYWNDCETFNDYLLWGASLDPMANTIYEGDRHSGRNYTGMWTNTVFSFDSLIAPGGSIVNFLGQPAVYLVFLFHSNSSYQYWGGFVDDISLGWDDGMFDLAAITNDFIDSSGNIIAYPQEGQAYYLRLFWEVEGEGTTPEFNINCRVDDSLFYSTRLSAQGNSTYYTLTDQMWSGAVGPHNLLWTLDVDDEVVETYEDNNTILYLFEVMQVDSIPYIIITRPTAGDSADQDFWIKWDAYDRESDAEIWLFYDPDSINYNGTPINSAAIHEDTDPDSFLWSTAFLPTGSQYYIYGLINDGYNPYSYDYSDYPLIINHTSHSDWTGSAPPLNFSFEGNFPNPFNASTTIKYSTPEPALVNIEIYDPNGRLVEKLLQQQVSPGRNSAVWNPKSGSGIYFCRLTLKGLNSGRNYQSTEKMLYLR